MTCPARICSCFPEWNDSNKPIDLPVKGHVKDPAFPKEGLNFLHDGEGDTAAEPAVHLEDVITDTSMLMNSRSSVHVQGTETHAREEICAVYTSQRLSGCSRGEKKCHETPSLYPSCSQVQKIPERKMTRVSPD